MRSLILSFFLLTGSIGFSQPTNAPDLVSFAKTIIGTPVYTLKDSLRCADAPRNNVVNADPAKCRAFFYFPEGENMLEIAAVNFPGVLLDTDSLTLVTSVVGLKSYTAEMLSINKKQFATDYNNIENYLMNLFQTAGVDEEAYKNEYYTKKGIKWRNDSYSIILDQTVFSKKGKRKKFSVIGVYVLREKL